MTVTYFPFAAGAGAQANQADWESMARYWLRPGVIGSGGGTVEDLNSLAVYADSSGMQVKVRSGKAWIQGYFYRSDAEQVLAVASNATGFTRTDLVVARLTRSTNSLAVAVITGASGGATPALTQGDADVYEIPLATISVANGASTIAAGNVTDMRVFAHALAAHKVTAQGGSNATTTSGSFATLTDMVATVYVDTGAADVDFRSTFKNSAAPAFLVLGLSVDGGAATTILDNLDMPSTAGKETIGSFRRIVTGLTVGWHQFVIQWATSTGTMTARPNRYLVVEPAAA